jgi:hypothetical protein
MFVQEKSGRVHIATGAHVSSGVLALVDDDAIDVVTRRGIAKKAGGVSRF